MNTRFLGTLCVLGAVAGVVEGVRVVLGRGNPDTLTYLLGLVLAGGMIRGILGMQALTVAGTGAPARVVFGVMLLAGTAQLLLTFFGLITGNAPDPLLALVGIVIVLGAFIVGIMTRRTGQWAGWRRYTPLLCRSPWCSQS